LRRGLRLLVGFELAHGWPVQLQSKSIVNDAIEDGVGKSWLADDYKSLLVPRLALA